MNIGLMTFSRGACAGRDGYISVAEAADRLGYAFLGANDHVVVPTDVASRYPYTDAGNWPGAAVGECLDQLATLAFVAGCTKRIRLLTSVMVVPHRHPILTAKMLASLDVLSGGRLIVGCGAGWMKEEIDVLGAPPFAERGRVTDEYIAAFKELWTAERPHMAGTFAQFSDIIFAPKPIQKPHPPIWIGGEGAIAMRRTVKLGDGWYPASNNPQNRLDTVARVAAAMAELDKVSTAAGRDPASIARAFVVLWPVSWTAETGSDGARKLMTGTSADMIADIAGLHAAGVRHLCLTFQMPGLPETLARMERFAAEVMGRG